MEVPWQDRLAAPRFPTPLVLVGSPAPAVQHHGCTAELDPKARGAGRRHIICLAAGAVSGWEQRQAGEHLSIIHNTAKYL